MNASEVLELWKAYRLRKSYPDETRHQLIKSNFASPVPTQGIGDPIREQQQLDAGDRLSPDFLDRNDEEMAGYLLAERALCKMTATETERRYVRMYVAGGYTKGSLKDQIISDALMGSPETFKLRWCMSIGLMQEELQNKSA